MSTAIHLAPRPAAATAHIASMDLPSTVSAGSVQLIDAPASIPTKLCAAGHANNPESQRCWTCDGRFDGAVVVTDKVPSTLARLLLEDGTAIDVVAELLVGRSPATNLGVDTLTLSGRQVSRRHLRLETRGWEVYIADCDSTNGTFLARQGERGRRRVPVDRAVPLRIGDTVHFGSRQALVVRPADH